MQQDDHAQNCEIKGGTNMSVKSYAKGVIKEGKRVRWPKREVLIPSIIVVVVIATIAGLLLFAEDWAGRALINILRDAFSGMRG